MVNGRADLRYGLSVHPLTKYHTALIFTSCCLKAHMTESGNSTINSIHSFAAVELYDTFRSFVNVF